MRASVCVRLGVRVTDMCFRRSYSGIVHAMRTIVQREGGVRTLYSGLGPTLLGIVPYAGINFFVYEKQKALWIAWNDKRDVEIPALHRLVFGAVAGAIGQTVCVCACVCVFVCV